jgi:hypothetical protein
VVKRVRERKLLVVICTDALGIGSDVKEVSRVIQWRLDSTTTLTSWWQRIGRGARDYSTTGIGYLLATLVEMEVQRFVARTGRLPKNEGEFTVEDRTGQPADEEDAPENTSNDARQPVEGIPEGDSLPMTAPNKPEQGRTAKQKRKTRAGKLSKIATKTSKGKKKQTSTDGSKPPPQSRADMMVLTMVCDVFRNGKCIRKICLDHLNQPSKGSINRPELLYSFSKPYDPVRDATLPCCNTCLDDPLPPLLMCAVEPAKKRKARRGRLERRSMMEKRLQEWRDEMWINEWAALGVDAFMGKDYFVSEGVMSDISLGLGQIEHRIGQADFELTDFIGEVLPEGVTTSLIDFLKEAIDIHDVIDGEVDVGAAKKAKGLAKEQKRLDKLQATSELAYERSLLGVRTHQLKSIRSRTNTNLDLTHKVESDSDLLRMS